MEASFSARQASHSALRRLRTLAARKSEPVYQFGELHLTVQFWLEVRRRRSPVRGRRRDGAFRASQRIESYPARWDRRTLRSLDSPSRRAESELFPLAICTAEDLPRDWQLAEVAFGHHVNGVLCVGG